MFCPRCGNQFDTNFCPKCGFKRTDATSPQINYRQTAPKKKKMSNGQAFLLTILIFVFAFGIAYISVNVFPSSPKKTEERVVNYDVTFAEIYREHERNKLVASEKYSGQWYRITGEAVDMSTFSLRHLQGVTLTMSIEVDGVNIIFAADFEEEQEKYLKQISIGDEITFIGYWDGSGIFKKCELVLPEE